MPAPQPGIRLANAQLEAAPWLYLRNRSPCSPGTASTLRAFHLQLASHSQTHATKQLPVPRGYDKKIVERGCAGS